jgi:hypothetical protein
VPRALAIAFLISSATASVSPDFGKQFKNSNLFADYLEQKGKFSNSADLSAWKKVLVDQQYSTAQM